LGFELIRIPKEIRKADRRGEELGLSEDDLHFMTRLKLMTARLKFWAMKH
jgi:hypothetical protein